MKKSKILVNSFFEELKERRKSIYRVVRAVIIWCIVFYTGCGMHNTYKAVEYTPETLSYYTSVASEIWNEGFANSSFEAQNITFNFDEKESIRVLNEGMAKLPHDDVSLSLTLEDGCKVSQNGDVITFEPSYALNPRIKVNFSKEEMDVSTYAHESILLALGVTMIILYFLLQFGWWLFYKLILCHIVNFFSNVYRKYKINLEEAKKNMASLADDI